MSVGQEAVITILHYANCFEDEIWLVSPLYPAHIHSSATLEYYLLWVGEGFFPPLERGYN